MVEKSSFLERLAETYQLRVKSTQKKPDTFAFDSQLSWNRCGANLPMLRVLKKYDRSRYVDIPRMVKSLPMARKLSRFDRLMEVD